MECGYRYLLGLVGLQYTSNLFPFCSSAFSIGFLVDNFFLLVPCKCYPSTFRHLLFLMRSQPLNLLEFPCTYEYFSLAVFKIFSLVLTFSIFTNVPMCGSFCFYPTSNFLSLLDIYFNVFSVFFLNQNFSHFTPFTFFSSFLSSPSDILLQYFGVLSGVPHIFKALLI